MSDAAIHKAVEFLKQEFGQSADIVVIVHRSTGPKNHNVMQEFHGDKIPLLSALEMTKLLIFKRMMNESPTLEIDRPDPKRESI